ncbi:thioredoxin fold domain-containing protein [Flavobacteriaceae bacterium W22]|nr:thioredoxin fold domain-containing protein [Flavobacteriaceae bacterium W22]
MRYWILLFIGVHFFNANAQGKKSNGKKNAEILSVTKPLNDSQIRWYDWMEIQALQEKNPKPFFVWIYADWCSHCKDFKDSTLQDTAIIKKLNSGDFYPVKLNFEDKRTFIFKNKSYQWIAATDEKMAHNELALAMMNNVFGLPSFVFFDKDSHVLQDVKGYKNSTDFKIISDYFLYEKYKTQDWNNYVKNIKQNNNISKESDETVCK